MFETVVNFAGVQSRLTRRSVGPSAASAIEKKEYLVLGAVNARKQKKKTLEKINYYIEPGAAPISTRRRATQHLVHENRFGIRWFSTSPTSPIVTLHAN